MRVFTPKDPVNWRDEIIVICDCWDFHHNIHLCIDTEEPWKNEDGFVHKGIVFCSLDVALHEGRRWYQRLWHFCKYVWHGSRYKEGAEFLLTKESATAIRDKLDKYLNHPYINNS